MKTIKSICLWLLVLSLARLGAPAEPLRTDINPALLYYRAFLMTPEPMSEADRDYLGSRKAKEQELPERFGRILAGHDNQFALVRQAAHATVPCDWGLDLGRGPNAKVPYLPRAKAVGQAAQYRAVWALQHDRQEEARDELLAAFVLARNVAADGLLISAWVQFAMETLDYATIAQHFGEFSPEILRQLADGFDAAPPRHTVAACLPMDKHCTYDWLVGKILELQKAYPNDDAKVMSGIRECGFVAAMDLMGDTNFWPHLLEASGGTSEGVLRLLREVEPLYPRLAQMMSLPQPEYETEANRFGAELQRSQNPFFSGVKMFFTGLALGSQRLQFRAAEFRVQAQLAMVRAAVEYRLHGEPGLKRVLDPFGTGPFAFRRFVFKGVDRGFELKSAYVGTDAPFVMIFVEKRGPAFHITGPDAGKAMAR